MFETEEYTYVTFSHRQQSDGVNSHVERRLEGIKTYDEMVNEFVLFLQNMGFTYIGGMIVLDSDGEEIHCTQDIFG